MATEKDILASEEQQEQETPVQDNETTVENNDQDSESQAQESQEEVDPLVAANAEIEELKKQLLYKAAEFDNYRKRSIKEKADLILNGGEKAITAILPVMDDLERALQTMQNADDVTAVVEGVELIRKKFMSILEKQGVRQMETADTDFNVDLHEAIAQFPAPTPELKGKIVDCTLKGYTLNEKVIRHAQVVVGL